MLAVQGYAEAAELRVWTGFQRARWACTCILSTLWDMAIRARKASPELHVAAIYNTLARAWGRQHWWPARSRFEVIVGTFLTQNTNWSNVEAALRQLRSAKVLNGDGRSEEHTFELQPHSFISYAAFC